MEEPSLQALITEASYLGGAVHPCVAHGHDWRMMGGRPCPRNEHAPVSQTVYRCARCDDYDYGEPGGPAHAECITDGPCDRRCGREGM
jgi:hypothetical protein